MTVTIASLAIVLGMIGILISLFIGTYGGKNIGVVSIVSLIVFSILLPIVLSMVYGYLIIGVTIDDWPIGAIQVPPQAVIFLGCWTGGFLGLKAGNIWHVDNDRSCLQCLLVPVSLLVLASLVILILP